MKQAASLTFLALASLLASSVDLIEIKDHPVATQLRTAILGYMDGEAFRPAIEIDPTSSQSLILRP